MLTNDALLWHNPARIAVAGKQLDPVKPEFIDQGNQVFPGRKAIQVIGACRKVKKRFQDSSSQPTISLLTPFSPKSV